MTERQQRFLDHLVAIALVDKAYAWWAAKQYAADPNSELQDMPRLLTERMKQLQGNK